ncbi:MAG: Two component transcriptional regulator PhoB, winged helix family [Candidatus Magasanikbacteria bacterium GW2011_GWC2_40_17]|uniref:Two component transcriptional regulator PhoB, winged helix family n=1 Tax=Candidatus Magasanikbacteria bacterium GW2011_GWA2_42_32 TaxID=1619039 RepID=A0A0G1A8F0_9BACT|nr:MAG: Two component transcriptional regulator PhoB, winged helix family [Candidatus Magasanikbacteria bacterium GW2011_GWC2_40_17]KKS57310.1 MAG: Two component transcriptional regulator PhoB, winged helix family [Candidatus Magasanikbacteria bacterium GW2011_GWA2_42_32]OGH85794.1 MAG: hypothetical protein A2294_02395 [Candidatus Magasanikbacteria bacterium RIFOXYB2_FULL_38_10]
MENQINKLTILVIEDEKPLLEAVSISLEQSGFKVVKSRIADQALQYLKDVGIVDLIWLDHYLLGDDGIKLTQKLKQEEKFKNIPIFVVSNSEDPEKKKQYLDLGVIKYFTKSDSSLEKIIGEIKEHFKK